ncbi:MAG: hypothetical protein ACLR7U_01810 [Ruthenibacterium lactatiformans]
MGEPAARSSATSPTTTCRLTPRRAASAAALTGPDAPANACNISSLRRAAVMGRASLRASPQGGTRRRLRPV